MRMVIGATVETRGGESSAEARGRAPLPAKEPRESGPAGGVRLASQHTAEVQT
jgi:hypothetical protein